MTKPKLKEYQGINQEDCLKYQRYLSYSFRRIFESSKKYVEELLLKKTSSELHFEKCLESWGIDFKAQYLILDPKFKYVIVDYYLPDYHLIVEIDGSVHYQPDVKARDIQKDLMLKSIGFPNILRITNPDALGVTEEWFKNYCQSTLT